MIDDQEIRDRATSLGVPESQVRRDHLLSHLIQGLTGVDEVVFVGGTALNRTHLQDVRLSEDADLHLLDGTSDDLIDHLISAVRLEFPGLTPASTQARGDVTTTLLSVDQLRVSIQVIRRRHQWLDLPATPTKVRLYYSDLPTNTEIAVPTPASFVAMKLSAYVDRNAPRDLFDLRQLVEHGAFSEEALALVSKLMGRLLVKEEFLSAPTEDQWSNELAHQVGDPGRPEDAFDIVFARLGQLMDW